MQANLKFCIVLGLQWSSIFTVMVDQEGEDIMVLNTQQFIFVNLSSKAKAAENVEACLLDCFEFVNSNHTRCEFELPEPSKKPRNLPA